MRINEYIGRRLWFSQHWLNYSCAVQSIGVERSGPSCHSAAWKPISVISAPAPLVFSTPSHRFAHINFWPAPFRFPSAHRKSLYRCKSKHNFLLLYGIIVNVLQLHGSTGWLLRLGGRPIYYLVANFVLYKVAKNYENWLLVNKVITKITGWHLFFWDTV